MPDKLGIKPNSEWPPLDPVTYDRAMARFQLGAPQGADVMQRAARATVEAWERVPVEGTIVKHTVNPTYLS